MEQLIDVDALLAAVATSTIFCFIAGPALNPKCLAYTVDYPFHATQNRHIVASWKTHSTLAEDVRFVFSQHGDSVVVERKPHQLFGDLASSETMKDVSHVDRMAFADAENFSQQLFELGMNNLGVCG